MRLHDGGIVRRPYRPKGGAMAVKLHRCSVMWIRGPHPCWRVQKALQEAGIDHEVVEHPPRRGKRDEIAARTGQRKLPVIEFEDGTLLREDSSDMVARIHAGNLKVPPPEELTPSPLDG
jgi:glutaredoxin